MKEVRHKFFMWMQKWLARMGRSRRLAILLAVALFASGVATFIALTQSGPLGGPNPRSVVQLLVLDLIFVLLFAALVARRLVQVWADRRSGVAGSKLHVRLVVMFATVAVIPAIVVAVFSAMLIEFGVEQWFNERVGTALDEAQAVATAYLQEHSQVIGGDALAMANDLSRDGLTLRSPALLSQSLQAQAAIRALSEALVFTADGRILARAGLAYSMELSIGQIPRWAYDRAKNGEVAVLTAPGDERVRAITLLPGAGAGPGEAYLYVGRFADPLVLAHMEHTTQAVAEYERLQEQRSSLEIIFAIIYSAVSLLLLLAAVWVGVAFASQLATPIIRLIDAAEKVRGGDLSARVSEEGVDDELGLLSRAFNRMTSQLDAQRSDLIDANRELDERRRFTEAVLAGVSAGVIGLDPEIRVTLPNRSAVELLGLTAESMIRLPLNESVPEMAALLELARTRPERLVQDEITIKREGRNRVLLVRIVAERAEETVSGFVVTFDDITELASAQRQAAWADVARRIAHEIKNPLTPIQLSAERLRRRYLKEITSDPETFISCTDTIVRQVGDIGRMVDEFSSFARMPTPIMKVENVQEIVNQAVFLAKTGYPKVAFETGLPPNPVLLRCDTRQLGQALTNLLKNAVEAIEARPEPQTVKGRILVKIVEEPDHVALMVEDNGKGLPEERRDRLTEPYVTTRTKGTGLGLAIVKKIMEDHGGQLQLDDLPGVGTGTVGTGTRASLIFPVERAANTGADIAPKRVSVHGA